MSTKFYAPWVILCSMVCALFLIPVASLADGSMPVIATEENNVDPLEPVNRKIYQFNNLVDRLLLKPVTKAYRAVIPAWGRTRMACFLRNLATPVTFFNSVLQGDMAYASTSFWRFTLNSTFGLGGLFDFAVEQGLRDRIEDFGQTAGVYDIPPGPYIVLPLLGPSTLRDAGGRGVDVFLDPFNYLASSDQIIARQALDTVESRSETLSLTNEIERTSLDPYATVRSLYLQSRRDLVHNGTEVPELEFQEE